MCTRKMSQVFYKVLIMETIPTCLIQVPYKVSTWMSNTQARPLCCTFNESESVSCSVVSSSLQPHGLKPARLLRPWDSLGKNTGVGCRSLLQGIFSTQGSNPGLLHCRRTLYFLSHQGRPHKSRNGCLHSCTKYKAHRGLYKRLL